MLKGEKFWKEEELKRQPVPEQEKHYKIVQKRLLSVLEEQKNTCYYLSSLQSQSEQGFIKGSIERQTIRVLAIHKALKECETILDQLKSQSKIINKP